MIHFVVDDVFLEHKPPCPHPERPERLVAIRSALDALGLRQLGTSLPVRRATADELERVHTAGYVAHCMGGGLRSAGWLDEDTYYSSGTLAAALSAAAAAIDCSRAVLNGDAVRAFALVRPPGHHAEADRAMGFCIFNNVAVAAADALASGLERVAIIDWDVHHGNGTQHIFDGDPRVLFTSIHQAAFYPGTGAPNEIGTGAGQGRTINVALAAGAGDADYLAVMDQLVAPAVRAHRPQLILISAGFDAHVNDPLAQMEVTTAGFGALGERACALANELCDGRIVFVLEGGYDLAALASSVLATVRAMMEAGEDAAEPTGNERPSVAIFPSTRPRTPTPTPTPTPTALRASMAIETTRAAHARAGATW